MNSVLGQRDVQASAHISPPTSCKLIRDFCEAHGLPLDLDTMDLSGITGSLLHELKKAMVLLHAKIAAEEVELCEMYGVEKPEQLKSMDRSHFNATMRSFITREDHYP